MFIDNITASFYGLKFITVRNHFVAGRWSSVG